MSRKKPRVPLKDNPEYQALLEDMKRLNQDQVDRILEHLTEEPDSDPGQTGGPTDDKNS